MPGGDVGQVRGCSYDMTVGTIFWDNRIISGTNEQVVVPPGGVIALLTAETLELPHDVCATAFAINAMSSQGFLVLNPGHVDPGYKGTLSIKAINVRKVPMPIQAGYAIFTVIFQRLPRATEPYPLNAKTKKDREQQLNATVVQFAPKTLFEMMALESSGGPFPSREEVHKMISKHWMSYLSLGAGIGAVVLSVLTLIVAFVAAVAAIRALPAPEAAKTPPAAVGELHPPTAQSAVTSLQTDPKTSQVGSAAAQPGPASQRLPSTNQLEQSRPQGEKPGADAAKPEERK